MPTDSFEHISGLIERVTYFAEETGFAVLKVAVKGRSDLVTVIGSAPVVNAGEWVSAQGRWVVDKQHGEQFKSEKLHCVPPSSAEGIRKYLGSGMVKGIGPVYAKKLVDAGAIGEPVLMFLATAHGGPRRCARCTRGRTSRSTARLFPRSTLWAPRPR